MTYFPSGENNDVHSPKYRSNDDTGADCVDKHHPKDELNASDDSDSRHRRENYWWKLEMNEVGIRHDFWLESKRAEAREQFIRNWILGNDTNRQKLTITCRITSRFNYITDDLGEALKRLYYSTHCRDTQRERLPRGKNSPQEKFREEWGMRDRLVPIDLSFVFGVGSSGRLSGGPRTSWSTGRNSLDDH